MYAFYASELSKQQMYKFLIGSVVPRPIALITSQSEEGLLNIAPFSFFNIVASEPALLSVAVNRKEGEMKDTARNILTTKEAVVHVVTEDNVVNANQTAALLPPDESELDHTTFTTTDSEMVSVPSLNESSIRFEVKLYQHVEIKNDRNENTSDLLLLEIQKMVIDEAIYHLENGHIDVENIKSVSRLAGNDYARLGETFTIERPQ
ncbi:TPA: flavin reductase family protein [Staphylococcus delphini]|nr:flavin reductase family protein [Staphylococcus delphini]HEC2177999.1 flavin reductase family protein [Staphylococcus delphini]HEC2199459.1 flavin reductase family protein [Staphylococcus delphini]HEC2228163.1 flavin reductase family protein [Staphylococcus delphini]HEC2230530.1 flavin reductase family protein [Staphylococcus delphini]